MDSADQTGENRPGAVAVELLLQPQFMRRAGGAIIPCLIPTNLWVSSTLDDQN